LIEKMQERRPEKVSRRTVNERREEKKKGGARRKEARIRPQSREQTIEGIAWGECGQRRARHIRNRSGVARFINRPR